MNRETRLAWSSDSEDDIVVGGTQFEVDHSLFLDDDSEETQVDNTFGGGNFGGFGGFGGGGGSSVGGFGGGATSFQEAKESKLAPSTSSKIFSFTKLEKTRTARAGQTLFLDSISFEEFEKANKMKKDALEALCSDQNEEAREMLILSLAMHPTKEVKCMLQELNLSEGKAVEPLWLNFDLYVEQITLLNKKYRNVIPLRYLNELRDHFQFQPIETLSQFVDPSGDMTVRKKRGTRRGRRRRNLEVGEI
jgi:hypothetical protein